jgi:hypothetical protein
MDVVVVKGCYAESGDGRQWGGLLALEGILAVFDDPNVVHTWPVLDVLSDVWPCCGDPIVAMLIFEGL